MLRKISCLCTLGMFICFSLNAQTTVANEYLELIRPEFQGNLAYETTAFVEQYWRVAGNTGFNKSMYWIADHLEKAGYVLESKANENDRFIYRIEKRPMKNPTWEPISASLHLIGEEKPLLLSTTNRNMTYLHSASTPERGVTAQVINIDENENTDLKGKIAYSTSSIGSIYKKLLDAGALGVITYNNPDYLQPEKNTTSIQFRSLPSQTNSKFWGIALSYEAKEKLENALVKGSTKAHINIQTKSYPAEELTVVAQIKGGEIPEEQLVFSAHVQEPGANDNATGVGVQLEMATLSAQLLKQEKINATRTLTFLWGDEIVSTRRYIQEDKKRAKGIKWGISLDMVGENTKVTGGTFLIEKMPDPSAIWARGNDKHSEWGGEVLSLDQMKPHYLNDFILNTFLQQGSYANWEVNTNPFEGGSDHTPFLEANIPGLLLWHFTDQFYHTDNDRLDKVSKKTLKNIGTATLASGLALVNSNTHTAIKVLEELEIVAKKRLETEYQLGKEAMNNGSSLMEETKILKTWENWYHKAYISVLDMTPTPNKDILTALKKVQKSLKEFNQTQISNLKP